MERLSYPYLKSIACTTHQVSTCDLYGCDKPIKNKKKIGLKSRQYNYCSEGHRTLILRHRNLIKKIKQDRKNADNMTVMSLKKLGFNVIIEVNK